MRGTLLIGLAGVAMALFGSSAVASAQPAPPPPPPAAPNVNAYAPVKTSEYAVMQGTWYAFATPDGLTCVIQRSGGYGCNGPIPGAPDGANLVSGRIGGVPVFSHGAPDVFAAAGAIKPLAANERLSYQTVSCGTDGTTTSCVDGGNQAGFVLTPAGSFIVGQVNPLLDRPEGTNPYAN
jgi:hypothetical protein